MSSCPYIPPYLVSLFIPSLYSSFLFTCMLNMQALHGHFTGTVDNICWLAPELLSQDLSGYSFQSDVYSVGIAALELATGEAPFAGLPVTEVCAVHLCCVVRHILCNRDSVPRRRQF